MPFKSEKQSRWMYATKPKMAKKWEKEKKDEAADRDYKDEYKKFQSSDKSKKYRAELNKYNRKKGTYGNGDGKDASHKGGKIAGFEAESKNRGSAEKIRLKKEVITPDFQPMVDEIVDSVIQEYSINEDLTKLRALYAQLDKQFKNYNHKKISDFNKVDKFLKTKFKKGSSLPDIVASFYNDYKGGEEIGKNHKRLFKYAKKMQGEGVNEAKFSKDQIEIMRKSYGTLSRINPSSPTYKKFIKFLEKLPKDQLKQLANAKIKFVSILAKNRLKSESVNEKMDPEQYHKYMQYVFDTQFKTPEEKKMKKSIIKKINVGQKKKGLPVFKESVNEGDKRASNKLYVNVAKAYKVFAKEVLNLAQSSVKLLGGSSDKIIIMKNFQKHIHPFMELIKSWNKRQQENPHIKESDLGLTYKRGKTVKVRHKTSGKSLIIIDKPNVRKEYEKIGFYAESVNEVSGVDVAKKVLKNKSYEKGIDLQTANLIVTIDKAYDKNPTLQKKFRAIPLQKMKQLVMKYYG